MDERVPCQAVICQNKYLLFSGLDPHFSFRFVSKDVKAKPIVFVNVDVIQELLLIAPQLYPFILQESEI